MITLTETAAVKVKELIEGEGEEGLALRVAVRPGGVVVASIRKSTLTIFRRPMAM